MKNLLSFLIVFGLSYSAFSQCTYSIEKSDVSCFGSNDGSIELTFDGWDCESSGSSCSEPVLPTQDYCSMYPVAASQDITVNTGEGVVVQGGYTGTIQLNGGTVVFCGVSTPSSISFNSGKIIIIGTTSLPWINANSNSSEIINYGTLSCNGLYCNGTIYNYGTITANQDFNVNSESVFENRGVLTAVQNFNNNNLTNNYGTIEIINNDFKNNGSGVFNNYCTVKVGETGNGKFFNDGIFNNYSEIKSYNISTLNGSCQLFMYDNSLYETKDLIHYNGSITAYDANCSNFTVTGNAGFNSSLILDGNIRVCGVDLNAVRIASPGVTIGANVTEDCNTCSPVIEDELNVAWTKDGYTYSESGETLSNLAAGIYEFNISCNGCSANETVIVNQPDVSFQSGLVSNPQQVCGNGIPAPIECTVPQGAIGSITYQWEYSYDNVNFVELYGATSNIVELGPNEATTYYRCVQTSICGTVTSEVTSVSIVDANFDIVFETTNVSELGNDGSATATLLGGVADVYEWSNGGSEATITNLTVGVYEVTISDDRGCSISEATEILPYDDSEETITNSCGDEITIKKSHVSCAGSADGEIEIITNWSCGDYQIPSTCSEPELPPVDYCNVYPIAQGNSYYTVNEGEGLVITDAFSGYYNLNGGTVVYCGTQSLGYLSIENGTIINIGDLTVPWIGGNDVNASFYNYGTITCSGITMPGNVYNNGTFTSAEDLTIKSTATWVNSGEVYALKSFNNEGVFVNNGTTEAVAGDFKNINNGIFTNNCTIKIGENSQGQFHNNNIFHNYGYIFSYYYSTLNSSGVLNLYSNSMFNTGIIQNYDGKIVADNASCCQFQVTGSYTFNSGSVLRGNICVSGVDLSQLGTGIVSGNVTEGCSCINANNEFAWESDGVVYEQTGSLLENLLPGDYTFSLDCNGCSVAHTVTINEPEVAFGSGIVTESQRLTIDAEIQPLICSAPIGSYGNISYQWQESTDNVTFSDIAGANGNTYTPADFGVGIKYFRCVQTSESCGTAISEAVTIERTTTDIDYTIVVHEDEICIIPATNEDLSIEWCNGSQQQCFPLASATNEECNDAILTGPDGSEEVINIPDFELPDIPDNDNPLCLFKDLSYSTPLLISPSNGEDNGSITVTLTGGNIGSIEWEDDALSGFELTGLGSGEYPFTIYDEDDCPVPGNVIFQQAGTVTPPVGCTESIFIPTFTVSNASIGADNGELTVNTGDAVFNSFEWNTGETTRTISNLPPGYYSVTFFLDEDHECSFTASSNIVRSELEFDEPDLEDLCNNITLDVNISASHETADLDDGVVHANLVNDLGATYEWNTPHDRYLSSVENVIPGTYTVTVTSSEGCPKTATITVDPYENPDPTCADLDLEISHELTNDSGEGGNGFISVNLQNSTNASYEWATGETTNQLINLSSGAYTVTATDVASACFISAQFTITPPEGPIPSICLEKDFVLMVTGTNITSQGANNGTAVTNMLRVNEGTYSWSNGSTQREISNLTPGIYSVYIVDKDRCPYSGSYEVVDFICTDCGGCTETEASLTFSTTETYGDGKNGMAEVSLNGGGTAASYVWSTGAITKKIEGLYEGIYYVTVTETGTDCEITGSIAVDSIGNICDDSPYVFDFNVSATDQVEFGINDGSASAAIIGSPEDYTYVWSNGGETQNIQYLFPGVYSVSVTSPDGCVTKSRFVRIHEAGDNNCQPNNISIQMSQQDGRIFADISGGIAESFTWQDANGTVHENEGANFPVASRGWYRVTAILSPNCEVSANMYIDVLPPTECSESVSVNISTSDETAGRADGYAFVSVQGLAPIYYIWSNGEHGINKTYIDGLREGNYYVTVAFNNVNCPAVTVNDHVGCDGCPDPEPDPDDPRLDPDDPNTETDPTPDPDPDPTDPCSEKELMAYANGTEARGGTFESPLIYGSATAYLEGVSSTGLSFIWSHDENVTTQTAENLKPGRYSVTVTEAGADGCSDVASVYIEHKEIIDPTCITTAVAVVTAYQDNTNELTPNGSITANLSDGTGQTYTWSNGITETTSTASGLSFGKYSVEVADADACPPSTVEQMILNGWRNDISVNGTVLVCEGNRTISIEIENGFPPFIYEWSGEGIDASNRYNRNLEGIIAGTYTVTITDNKGNQNTTGGTAGTEFIVPENNTLSVTLTATDDCIGGNVGSVSATVSGGSGDYSYQWSNGGSSNSITNLGAGTYGVTVTDLQTLCTADGNETVTESGTCPSPCDNFSVTADITKIPSEIGRADGEVFLTVYGGTGTYDVTAGSSPIRGIVGRSSAQTLSYTVTETIQGVECSASDEITIPASRNPDDYECRLRNVEMYIESEITCPGSADGEISIDFAGVNTSDYTVTWGSDVNVYTKTGLSTGYYSATIQHNLNNTCSKIVEATLREPQRLRVYSGTYDICPGDEITFTANYDNVTWAGDAIKEIDGSRMVANGTGNFTVEVNNYDECTETMSQTFSINERSYCPENGMCVPVPDITVPLESDCHKEMLEVAHHNAINKYNNYIEEAKKNFRREYIAKCLSSEEELTMSYSKNEYSSTLYYYDLAGNLVKTVPPQGVQKVELDKDVVKSLKDEIAEGTVSSQPEHTYNSVYTYNSLNQLIGQNIPDHDPMTNKYDDDLVYKNGLPSVIVIKDIAIADNGQAILIGESDGNGAVYVASEMGQPWSQASNASNKELFAVQYITDNLVYAAGEEGTFIKSEDGGATWQNEHTGMFLDFHYMFFSDVDNGFLFQNTGEYFATTNGGENWNGPYELNLPNSATIAEMEFDAGYWYVAYNKSNEGYVSRTADQGLSWEPVLNKNIRPLDISSVSMVSTSFGYAVGQAGTFLRTVNGGSSWEKLQVPFTNNISNAFFIDAQKGFIKIGSEFHYTNDGGITWTEDIFEGASFIGWDIDYASEQVLFTQENALQLFNCSTELLSEIPVVIANVAVNDFTKALIENNAIIVGSPSSSTVYIKRNIDSNFEEIIVSEATGEIVPKSIQSETEFIVTQSTSIYGVSYIDNSFISAPLEIFEGALCNEVHPAITGLLYAEVDTEPVLFISNTNGENWNPTTIDISAVSNIAPQVRSPHIFALNSGGMVYSFKDDAQWSDISAAMESPRVNGLHVNGAEIAVCGEEGFIAIKEDDASVWQLQNIPNGSEAVLNDISATTTGYISAGTDGMNYSSSGGTWTAGTTFGKTINDISNMNGVPVLAGDTYLNADDNLIPEVYYNNRLSFNVTAVNNSGNAAVAVGENGAAARFSGSWLPAENLTPQVLNGLSVTGNTAYATGVQGTLLKSTDGGTSWEELPTPDNNDYTAISFANSQVGIIAASTSNIKFTTNGGLDFTPSDLTGLTAGISINKALMFSPTRAVLIGANGTILISDNGGQSWFGFAHSSNVNLLDIEKTSNNTFLISGEGGMVSACTIGYNEEPEVPEIPEMTLTFNNGISPNSDPAIVTDGTTGIIIVDDITVLTFKDMQYGYAATTTGSILKTYNGGESWILESDFTGPDNTVAMVETGSNDLAVASSNGGVSKVHDDNGRYTSKFWYDELGRIVVSQNAEQFREKDVEISPCDDVENHMSMKRYSYSKYDYLGRVIEVGEVASIKAPFSNTNKPSQISRSNFSMWLSQTFNENHTYSQITKTYYDRAIDVSFPYVEENGEAFEQENLRNRVASVAYYENNCEANTYVHASHYSYDIHGNVKTLIQEMPEMGDNQFKRVDYEYDLISGNVTQVVYQKGFVDQFAHRYTYDADNRLLRTETSTDLILWNEEAEYTYYRHGPLARTELAGNLQGMDYVYTLQGWLKGVNASGNNADPGADVSETFADEFGYMLGYYSGDYSAINANYGGAMPEKSTGEGSDKVYESGAPLYNGNISSMVTTISSLSTPTNGMSYSYDQLNRISKSRSHAMDGSGWAPTEFFDTDYTYDLNGNLKTLQRNAKIANAGQKIDNFSYSYYDASNSDRNTNRLRKVTDAVESSSYEGDDFVNTDPSPAIAYNYDAIGNLINDAEEGIDSIKWNVSGKITRIIKEDPVNNLNLKFKYDAMGNRVYKATFLKVPNGEEFTEDIKTITHYVHDATGNIMATYTIDVENSTSKTEMPIYGSSRIGMHTLTGAGGINKGERKYELNNHLGNVLVVFSDRIEFGSDVKNLHIEQTSDYYPFGMQIRDRMSPLNPEYRFGFNGQEKDNEIYGDGNSYTAEFWQYDARLARRWNLDPKPVPSISQYSCFVGNPILLTDHLGDTAQVSYSTIKSVYNSSTKSLDVVRENVDARFVDGKWINSSTRKEIDITDPHINPSARGLMEDYSYLNTIPQFSPVADAVNSAPNIVKMRRIAMPGTSGSAVDAPKYFNDLGAGVANPDIDLYSVDDSKGWTNFAFFEGSKNHTWSTAIGMGHELGHVWDILNSGGRSYNFAKHPSYDNIPMTEMNAMYWENVLRNIHDLPLRLAYGTDPSGKLIAKSGVSIKKIDLSHFMNDMSNPFIWRQVNFHNRGFYSRQVSLYGFRIRNNTTYYE